MEYEDKRIILEENITSKLLKMMVSYDALNDNDKGYLLAIEDAIWESYQLERELRESLKKNKISLINISKRTNIARQTFYNNPILKKYVKLTEKEFEREYMIAKEYRYQDEIRKLNEIIETMVIRDCVIEDQKITINELKKKLAQTNDNIISLTNRLKKR